MVSGKSVAGTFILPKGNGKYFMCLQLLQILHGKLLKDLSKLYKDGLFIWFTYYIRNAYKQLSGTFCLHTLLTSNCENHPV